MKRVIVGLILFASMAAIAKADCRRVVRVNDVVRVDTVAVAAFVPVVSLFSVGPAYPAYAPQPAAVQQAASPCDSLAAEVKQLRAEMAAIRNQAGLTPAPVQPPPQGQTPAAPTNFQAVIAARCANCHAAAAADKKGGGQVLIEDDGKIPPFSPAERKAILADIAAGAMPKGKPPLAANEQAIIKNAPEMGTAVAGGKAP